MISQLDPAGVVEHAFAERVALALRDPIDQRIVREAVEACNKIIDSQDQVGGYPNPEPVNRPIEVPEKGRREWLQKLARQVGG